MLGNDQLVIYPATEAAERPSTRDLMPLGHYWRCWTAYVIRQMISICTTHAAAGSLGFRTGLQHATGNHRWPGSSAEVLRSRMQWG